MGAYPGVSQVVPILAPYKVASREVKPEPTAVAAGTLIHGVMWVTLTSAGLLVLRIRHTSLGEVDEAAEAPSP